MFPRSVGWPTIVQAMLANVQINHLELFLTQLSLVAGSPGSPGSTQNRPQGLRAMAVLRSRLQRRPWYTHILTVLAMQTFLPLRPSSSRQRFHWTLSCRYLSTRVALPAVDHLPLSFSAPLLAQTGIPGLTMRVLPNPMMGVAPRLSSGFQ